MILVELSAVRPPLWVTAGNGHLICLTDAHLRAAEASTGTSTEAAVGYAIHILSIIW